MFFMKESFTRPRMGESFSMAKLKKRFKRREILMQNSFSRNSQTPYDSSFLKKNESRRKK